MREKERTMEDKTSEDCQLQPEGQDFEKMASRTRESNEEVMAV